MLKQVGTVIVFVWMVIVKLCRSVIGRRGEKKVVPAQRTENSEWKVAKGVVFSSLILMELFSGRMGGVGDDRGKGGDSHTL